MALLRKFFVLPIALVIMVMTAAVFASDNSCLITAEQQNDVWVVVYDADDDGNRNQKIWEGKIDAGKNIKINSTGGQIRYDYKLDPNQPYEGDVSRWCNNQNTILVP